MLFKLYYFNFLIIILSVIQSNTSWSTNKLCIIINHLSLSSLEVFYKHRYEYGWPFDTIFDFIMQHIWVYRRLQIMFGFTVFYIYGINLL